MQNNNKQSDNTAIDSNVEKTLAPYLETLGLNTLPFSSDIPGNQYFIEPDRQQHLDQLSHLVQSSDMILIISGEQGVGKTTLLNQFIARPSNNFEIYNITANTDTTENDLLACLSRDMNLPDNLANQVMHELIREKITTLHRNNRIPVILVDDAYTLSSQTLKTLLDLQSDNSQTPSPCRIILFTQPSHNSELAELKDRLHFIQVFGLDIEQTKAYISHRLRTAGYTNELPFSEKELITIQKNSQGNFIKIHQYAHETLLNKPVHTKKEPKRVKPEPPKKQSAKRSLPAFLKPGILMSFVAIIAISTVLYFQNEINQAIQNTSTKDNNSKNEILTLPVTPPAKLASIPDDKTINWETIPALSLNKKIPPPAENKPKVLNNIKAPLSKEPSAAKKISNGTQLTRTPNKTKPTAADPLDTLLAKNHINGKKWILKQNKNDATAQIMASSKPDALIKYANKSSLKGKTAIYRVKRNNNDWFVLIYGVARSKASIMGDIRSLPASIQRNRPWPRLFNVVQNEIKTGKK
ncbi:MAG: AAA family ATPase [Gammaproteobacteria bacterium]|nr:AAA family ATPase [Gammaproteobacteria bacterium]